MGDKSKVEGWICPECNKVHAPWVLGCDCQYKKDKDKDKSKDIRNGFNPIKPLNERI